tara:strand:- start:784 stop:1836 length:1053 start_codon:yes stop_codon:yes gene_type:complete
LEITTPGRICLFGEHQDYLGLPVIAMGISLRATISGYKRSDRQVIIHKPDLEETEIFSLDNLNYNKPRDYFKSAINVCSAEGLIFENGFECEIKSNIPIKAGTSSSSAITVSWIHFLSYMTDKKVEWDKKKMADLAYRSEVIEFQEPGGMMDQYSTAIGNLVYIESEPKMHIQKLKSSLGSFVLGDSQEPKETLMILKRCRDIRLELFNVIRLNNRDFNLHSSNVRLDLSDLNNEERALLNATIKNRDILRQAKIELIKTNPDHQLIGSLLNNHHYILRDDLHVSTNKIERMLDAAMSAGAFGGKINGSGGGGCMFAYAPEDPEAVAKAIELAGGKSYIINADEGTKALT